MTADNPAALVLAFQGNDGIHQSIQEFQSMPYTSCALGGHSSNTRMKKKSVLLRVALHYCNIHMQTLLNKFIFNNLSETTNM